MRISLPLVVAIAAFVVVISVMLLPKPGQIGQALDVVGRFDDAVAYYMAALESNPTDELTRIRLASVHELRGEPELAIAAYRRLVEQTPNDIGYRRSLAELYDWTLQVDAAAAEKARVVALDGRDIVTRSELVAYHVLEHKDYLEAIRLTEEMVAARPDDVDLLIELAGLYSDTKQIGPAIATFERALALDAGNPLVLRGLARMRSWESRVQTAVSVYRQQLTSNPTDRTTMTALRDLLRSSGQTVEAEEIERRLGGPA